jgi:hypothetical protein
MPCLCAVRTAGKRIFYHTTNKLRIESLKTLTIKSFRAPSRGHGYRSLPKHILEDPCRRLPSVWLVAATRLFLSTHYIVYAALS